MDSWRANNNDREIKLNGNELFRYEQSDATRLVMKGEKESVRSDIDIHYHNEADQEHIKLDIRKITVADELQHYSINSYLNDQQHGLIIDDDTSRGVVEYKVYLDDKENGPVKQYMDGNLLEEWYCVDRWSYGETRFYYRDSQRLKHVQTFTDGKGNGPVLHWYDDDQHTIESKAEYKNGRIASIIFYRPDGIYITADIEKNELGMANRVTALKFYDGQDRLFRLITDPLSATKSKHDIHYDKAGLRQSLEDVATNLVYDIDNDSWHPPSIVNTELQPFL